MAHKADEHPSLLWIVIPPALLVAGYLARKWYLARRLRLHGIGKGAPGFQTGVRRVRVTPDVAARLQRGEDVTPDEIAASIARAQRQDEGAAEPAPETSKAPTPPPPTDPVNEWLPESITSGKKHGKRRRK